MNGSQNTELPKNQKDKLSVNLSTQKYKNRWKKFKKLYP